MFDGSQLYVPGIISHLLDEVLVLGRAAGELPRRDAESPVARHLPLLVLHLVLEHLRVRQVAVHRRLQPPQPRDKNANNSRNEKTTTTLIP